MHAFTRITEENAVNITVQSPFFALICPLECYSLQRNSHGIKQAFIWELWVAGATCSHIHLLIVDILCFSRYLFPFADIPSHSAVACISFAINAIQLFDICLRFNKLCHICMAPIWISIWVGGLIDQQWWKFWRSRHSNKIVNYTLIEHSCKHLAYLIKRKKYF